MSEEQFFSAVMSFFEEIGAETDGVTPETNLFAEEVLDSLATLAFLDFLSEQIGEEIDLEELDIATIATLGNAYRHYVASR